MGDIDSTLADDDESAYRHYKVDDSDQRAVSAAFLRQAEHLHLEIPDGLAVAADGLTRSRVVSR